MASMGDMPNVARNIMSFCSGHGLYNNGFLGLKKRNIGRIQALDSALFISLSRPCRGPTPNANQGEPPRRPSTPPPCVSGGSRGGVPQGLSLTGWAITRYYQSADADVRLALVGENFRDI